MGGNDLNLDRVTRLLDLLSRAVRTCQVYPHGHDLRSAFLTQLFDGLTSYLETEGRLECYIEDLTLYDSSGRELFQGRKEDLFPWGLYKNGIRGLVFYKGLTYGELKEFIDLLVGKTDNLLYFLLEADMTHISFDVAEYVVLDDEEVEPSGNGKEVEEENLDFGGDLTPHSSPLFQDFSLTEEELAYLNRELREAGKDYFSSYLGVILDIFSMDEYSDVAEDLIQGVGMLALESLGWGDLYLSLSLVKRLKELLSQSDLDVAKREYLAAVLDRMRSPEILGLIRKNYSPSWGDSLLEFLKVLDFQNIDSILNWLEEEEREGARRILVSFLAKKMKESPELLVYCFNRGGPRVPMEVVQLAGRLGKKEGREVLTLALDSRWEGVRREALKITLKLDPGSLEQLATRFLASSDSDIRTVLFDAVVELGGVASVAPLLELEASREDFILRSYLEKRQYFYALFLSDSALFKKVLGRVMALSPGWRNRKKWEETLGVAFGVALDSGKLPFEELGEMVGQSGNRKALKVWEKVLRVREGAR